MEAVALILGALASGAGQGLQETASTAVQDAYTRLRDLVTNRFAGHRQAEAALEGYAADPDTWAKPLEKSLQDTGAVEDASVVEAALNLMSLLEAAEATSGHFVIQVRDSSGVQFNNQGGNVQVNTFHS